MHGRPPAVAPITDTPGASPIARRSQVSDPGSPPCKPYLAGNSELYNNPWPQSGKTPSAYPQPQGLSNAVASIFRQILLLTPGGIRRHRFSFPRNSTRSWEEDWNPSAGRQHTPLSCRRGRLNAVATRRFKRLSAAMQNRQRDPPQNPSLAPIPFNQVQYQGGSSGTGVSPVRHK